LYLLAILGLMLFGCGSTKAQKGGTSGAALGAIVGGLAGGSVGSAAVGAAAGGGLGYIIGNEADKEEAKEKAEEEREALKKSKITSEPETAYRPPNDNPLVGSTWRVLSIVSDEPLPEYHSMVVTFQTNTKLTTLTVWGDGQISSEVESYRVVDDVLIISGKDYLINAKYTVNNKQLIIVEPKLRMVMEEVEEKV